MDGHPQTDEELMRSFAAGDNRGIKIIFERYKTRIFNFCLRFLNNHTEAEEAVSQTFMVLCSNKYLQTPNAKFSTWLYTVARNECISRLRKQKSEVSPWVKDKESNEFEVIDFKDTKPLPNEESQEKDIQYHIKEAVAKLPPDQKEAIILREYQDLSYEEIARILHCSLSNVKILIFRARETLRKDLYPFINEGRT